MKDRIKRIRDDLNLNQAEFGARIGVQRSTIAGYENGNRTPIDAIVSSICKEFNVNRRWLETGEGEAYMKSERSEDLAAEIRDILKGEHPMMIAAMAALAQMEPEWWDAWAKKLHEEIEKAKKGDG